MKHHAEQFKLLHDTIDMTTQTKRYPACNDDDLIQFGKHKGLRLQDVPATYLAWAWNAFLKKESRNAGENAEVTHHVKVANYIWNSREALEEELGDTLEGRV